MKISKTIFPQYPVYHQSRGAVQKKHGLSLSQGSFSLVLSQAEGKAAAIFLRGAYGEYVSTEKWRERR